MRPADPLRPRDGALRRAALWGVVGAALWLFSGCAYYNTFYFAKRYYRQAEKMVQNAGSDKLPPEAAKKYEDSIKQSGKVIKFHGGSRWVDDALYLMGAAYYGKRDYEEALRKFDELVTNYPDSPFVPWALYRSGLCHYERKNYEQMGAYFHRVREGYPKFERRDDLLYIQARASEDRRQRPEAIRLYRDLVRDFPKSPRAPEGLRRIGDLYYDAGRADSAYASFTEMGRLSRDEATWRQAQLRSADALIRLDRAAEAASLLEELLPHEVITPQSRPTEIWPAEVHLGLARAYNADRRPREALTSLRMVTGAYTNSPFVPEAQFQIGYTYETYLDSLEAARTAYDQVARVGSSSVYKEQAAQRSRNLQQLQSLRTQAENDSTSDVDRAAGAQLRIAELYLLSQDKPAEAMEKYRQVIAEYPESRIAPRAAYAIAWMRLRRLEVPRDSALAGFVDLVHRYPASPAARGAIELLAAEGADTTGLASMLVELAPDTTALPPEAAPEPLPAESEAEGGRRLSSPPQEMMEQAGRGRGAGGLRPEGPGVPDSLRRWLEAADSSRAPAIDRSSGRPPEGEPPVEPPPAGPEAPPAPPEEGP